MNKTLVYAPQPEEVQHHPGGQARHLPQRPAQLPVRMGIRDRHRHRQPEQPQQDSPFDALNGIGRRKQYPEKENAGNQHRPRQQHPLE